MTSFGALCTKKHKIVACCFNCCERFYHSLQFKQAHNTQSAKANLHVHACIHAHGKNTQNLMEEGLGDHILLLRLWEGWRAAGFNRDFCKDHGLDLRGMNFAKDIRKQLDGKLRFVAFNMLFRIGT